MTKTTVALWVKANFNIDHGSVIVIVMSVNSVVYPATRPGEGLRSNPFSEATVLLHIGTPDDIILYCISETPPPEIFF